MMKWPNPNQIESPIAVNFLNADPGQRSRTMILSLLIMVGFFLFSDTGYSGSARTVSVSTPKVNSEFRGAWVATVNNIDWPSKPGLETGEMKAELRSLIHSIYQSGFNAVMFQVRPACEVLYPSRLEPWSEVLTGKCGTAPAGNYDPVAHAIQLTHSYGMEFHAWINPFRARHKSAKSKIPENHISKTDPGLVIEYSGYLWLNPALKEAQAHTLAIAREIASKYDVDGFHIDDYFYPYLVKKKNGSLLEFPDWSSYTKYRKRGGKLGHADWRRDSINQFVKSLYSELKAIKPWIKIGISPFGIWRPNHPPGIVGKDSYLELYADSKLWLNMGWLDYFSPQLYWAIDSSGQPFEKLQDWWTSQNSMNRHLYTGINLSKSALGDWDFSEIQDQISLTRQDSEVSGHVLFSAKYVLPTSDSKSGNDLKRQVYNRPALVPRMPWIPTRFPSPNTPEITLEKTQVKNAPGTLIRWNKPNNNAFRWVVQSRKNNAWKVRIIPGKTLGYFLSDEAPKPDIISIRSVTRDDQISQPISISLN